jgi:hypothetical protein
VSAATPRLARVLLAAMTLSFAAVVLRNAFGVTIVWPAAWDNAYNFTQFLAIGACALRALTVAGHERAAWLALTAGLLGFALGDAYWTVALADLESRRTRRSRMRAT